MVDEVQSANGTASSPRKVDSETIKMTVEEIVKEVRASSSSFYQVLRSPIPASRMVVLILSSAVGGWLSYDVLTRFPHSFAAILLAIMAFLFSVGMGAGLAHMAGVSARVIAKVVARGISGPRRLSWNAQMETKNSGEAPQRGLASSRGRS